jgi:O-antigen chain-terminating methyltransferase
MFRINDPEIGAEELIRRVRDESRRREAEAGRPGISELPVPDLAAQRWASAHHAIAVADQYSAVGARLPPMSTIRGLKRKLIVPIANLILRAAQLVTREQTSFNIETTNALRAVADAAATDTRGLESRLATTLRELRVELATLAKELAQHREVIGARVAELDAAGHRALAAEQSLEQALWAWRQESLARSESDASRAATESAGLRRQLLVHERRIGLLAEEPRPPETVRAPEELDPLLDAFYVTFEDRFRGPREEIRKRVSVYLPVVRESNAGAPDRPIFDLGCGRGEWLELLGEHGLVAKGVDSNFAVVTEGQARRLDVRQADVLAYLRELPDQSCGAVTAFHLAEHLPFPMVIKLVDEIVRVLRPGGVAILETPNPKNLMVGSCSFYVDPTHRRPLHPETMAFLAETRGLDRVQVRFLHPVEEGRLPDNGAGIAARLNEYLFGPQDFAVIGYRT